MPLLLQVWFCLIAFIASRDCARVAALTDNSVGGRVDVVTMQVHDIRAGARHIEGAAVALAAVLLVAPMWTDSSLVRALAIAGLVSFVTAGLVTRSATVVRAAVVLLVAATIFVLGMAEPSALGSAVTTIAVCVLPVLALQVLGRRERWQPTTPWLRVGHVERFDVGVGMVTVAGAALALVAWAAWRRPESNDFFQVVGDLPLLVTIAAVVGFALVNPIWEEAIFRGVIQEELSRTWGVPTAVVIQAVLFGSAHWAGFPSGWTGMAMASAWGLVLGILRARTGGIALPYVVHVAANATIGTLAVTLLI